MEQVIVVTGKFHADDTVCGLILCMVLRKFFHSSLSHEFCDIVVKLVNYGCDIIVKIVMLLYL
jgi:hypothetical protein